MMIYDNIDDIKLNVLESSALQIRINNNVYKLEHILCNGDNVNDSNQLIDIGKFRYYVWEEVINSELSIDKTYGEGIWLDELDFIINSTRNFIIKTIDDDIVGVARMTFHQSFNDTRSRDLIIFKEYNVNNIDVIQSPVVDLGRLVIKKEFRGLGIAQFFNRLRISIAKQLNAKYIIVTASNDNALRLKKLGFLEINKIVYFDDRPLVPFHCLQLSI